MCVMSGGVVLRVLEGVSCGEYFFSELFIMPLGPGGLLKECLLQLFLPLLALFPYVFDDFEQVIAYFELIYFVVTTTIVSFQLVLV